MQVKIAYRHFMMFKEGYRAMLYITKCLEVSIELNLQGYSVWVTKNCHFVARIFVIDNFKQQLWNSYVKNIKYNNSNEKIWYDSPWNKYNWHFPLFRVFRRTWYELLLNLLIRIFQIKVQNYSRHISDSVRKQLVTLCASKSACKWLLTFVSKFTPLG